MHHIARALPADSRDIANIHRVAAALVIHVADNGVQVLLLRLKLVGSSHVESAFTGKVPAGVALWFVRVRKTCAVGVVLRKTRHVVGGSDDLVFALGEISR